MFTSFTRAPHLLLDEFYDFAQSATAALRLEATSRVASSWLFRFTYQVPIGPAGVQRAELGSIFRTGSLLSCILL